MFALIVFIQKILFYPNIGSGIHGGNLLRSRRHFAHLFKDQRIFHCLERIAAPSKRTVAVNKHGGNLLCRYAPLAELLYNDFTCILLIGGLYFFLGKPPCARYGAVGKIRMGGAVGGNIPPCLRPGTRPV